MKRWGKNTLVNLVRDVSGRKNRRTVNVYWTSTDHQMERRWGKYSKKKRRLDSFESSQEVLTDDDPFITGTTPFIFTPEFQSDGHDDSLLASCYTRVNKHKNEVWLVKHTLNQKETRWCESFEWDSGKWGLLSFTFFSFPELLFSTQRHVLLIIHFLTKIGSHVNKIQERILKQIHAAHHDSLKVLSNKRSFVLRFESRGEYLSHTQPVPRDS